VVLALPLDLKPCVGLWHPEEYDRYSRRALAELPPLSPSLTEMERFFYGQSQEAELDASGRVIVPGFLSERARIEKEVVIVGAGDRLELWSKDGWNEHRPTLLSGVARITANVDDTA
jgi:MraZ protein